MRTSWPVVLACLGISVQAQGADGEPKKWLTGRWALAGPEKPATAKTEPTSAAPSKSKTKAKTTPNAKKPSTKASNQEIPKFVLEFTSDGKVRLDGETSALGESFRFIKPLAAVSARVAPQALNVKIDYRFNSDDTVEIVADHSWLLEKLSSGGGSVTPEQAKELKEVYFPRETLRVAANSKVLTLSNDQGRSLTFHRYAGPTLDEAESKRRAEEVRKGLSPFEDILRKQGINTGNPAKGKTTAKKKGTRQ